jgi:polysaccharide biosynthesis protein PslH
MQPAQQALRRLSSGQTLGTDSQFRMTELVSGPRFARFVKRVVFDLLGKEPEAVVVSFATGPQQTVQAMVEEVRRLVPERRHFIVTLGERSGLPGEVVPLQAGSTWQLYRQLRRAFRPYRIGLAPVLFTRDPEWSALRRAAFLLAPRKLLAYNFRLERHHLRLSTGIASALFLKGVPLDRIFLMPRWLVPWKKDRSIYPGGFRLLEGRPLSPNRKRVAVLSPYFPYPLAHGGAVRIYNLLREASREFDIFLFAFSESGGTEDCGPVLDFCAGAVLVDHPRYREPRWSSLRPPEVREYDSPAMRKAIESIRHRYDIPLLQVEYTSLASYGGDVLVEHDITFDLYSQIRARTGGLSAWWNWRRWRSFETRATGRYRRVVVMSEKDSEMLPLPQARVIPNGVDLDRFRPEPECPGQQLLFIGSFRHFPNIVAYRFFTERVWPLLRDRFPDAILTVVAGPEPLTYWRGWADSPAPAPDPHIRMLEFVSDVRPLYHQTNVVLVPTLESAGTNIKALEAMAMERAMVLTPSGAAGLDLEHKRTAWIAADPESFSKGVEEFLSDPAYRHRVAGTARRHAQERFGWERLGELQRQCWRELL